MNILYYNTWYLNWSVWWLVGFVILGIIYLKVPRTGFLKKSLFFLGLFLLYVAFGSPLSSLADLGLHSATMFQQMLVLMVVPVLLLKSMPTGIFEVRYFRRIHSVIRLPYPVPAAWIIGALAMWGGHFLTAAILSSKMGIAICGIAVSHGSWISGIPISLVFLFELLAGLIFALPVFHPDTSWRIRPLPGVIYLFTACVSCSVLGLYITFSASSAHVPEAVPLFDIFQNPLSMSLRTDQEIAGLLMWVPGCIIYVAACMDIVFKWLEGEPVPLTHEEYSLVSIRMKNKETKPVLRPVLHHEFNQNSQENLCISEKMVFPEEI